MRYVAILALVWMCSAVANAGPMSEARALGQASVGTIHKGINDTGAQWTQPAIEASPDGYAPYGVDPASAAQEGFLMRARCADNANARPECAGLNQAGSTQDIYANARANPPEEAQALRTGQLPLDAALADTRVGIGGNYSACTTSTSTTGRKYFDEQYCHNYYLRVLDQPCTKTLDVEVTWHYACPSYASGPYPRDPYWGGGDPVPHYCEYTNTYWEHYCEADDTLAYKPGVGYQCYDTNNVASPVLWREESYTDTFAADTWATERDIWNNPCAGYDARVPAGLLPPDGSDIPTGSATGTGPVDKCERTTSLCTQPRATRWINNHPVTRNCWAYSAKYTCLNLDPKSDCNQPRWGSCTNIGTNCVDWDQFIPNVCTATQTRFSCMVEDTTRQQTVTNCAGQVFTDSHGHTWDTGHEPDSDLGRVAVYMEAGREAGAYLDPNTLEIFKGYDSRCKKKLFGLVNCCNKGGSGSGSLFSNSAIAAATAAGNAGVSTYMYDALFVSDAPNLVINGFASVFGSGTSSALAGFLAGEVSVQSFLSSLVPGPWSLAMLALQFSGLMDCKDADIETALKRDARLCVDLGAYCSKKLPLIGTCLERTYSHCCFNSLLAKSINTQGKAMLGMGMGTARHPNCGGFTASQLQSLDLSAMDLAEFLDQVNPAAVSPDATSCYFQGETSCPAVH